MAWRFWQGDQIILRALQQKDLDEISAGMTYFDDEDERNESEIPFPLSPEEDRAQVEKLMKHEPGDDAYFWIITDLAGQTVGYITTFECNRRMGNFRYAIAIRREFRRRGFAQEAVRIVLRYYLRELRYQKVTTAVYIFNQPSLRFHRSFGFVEEGRLRSMVFTNGQYYDEFHFGLTREEFDRIDPPAFMG